ncbi:MAG: sigma-70 family RNA polymerase sigma factor [Verrucomicrobia bacterium]|nr:sigma-70 family RNA polymerase sigma factor [Verrucomicrobiota bacterium]
MLSCLTAKSSSCSRGSVGQDKEAFDSLYKLTGTMLYSIAFSLMGNEAEAKDAFQESLVKIWERASTYDPEKGNSVAWIARLTRNTCLDKLRARKRFRSAIDRAAEDLQVQSVAHSGEGETSGAQLLISRERADNLLEAMQLLPADQRVAIEMAFLKGMTQTEVAEELGEPLGTIKARIRRGMLKLQSSLTRRASETHSVSASP